MSDEVQNEEVESTEKSTNNGAIGANYRDKYGKEGHCGDELAEVLKVFTRDDETKKVDLSKLKQVCEQNEIEFKWDHLNAGMQRMTVGNILRAKHKKGVDILIGEDTIKGAPQPEKEAEAAE